MPHPDTAYWDTGIANVPQMTGTTSRLDAEDLRDVFTRLGVAVPLMGGVLDVGCGTGRLRRLVSGDYLGLDITRSSVDYCRERGICAYQIEGAKDVCAPRVYEWVTAISLFTHLSDHEQIDYLSAFRLCGENLIVDIVPGEPGGDVRLYRATPDVFDLTLLRWGFSPIASADLDWDGITHRFYWVTT